MTPDKPPKPKKCKHCGDKFTPQRSLQYICSPKCASEYTRAQQKKKEAKEWQKEKKVLRERLETKTDVEKKLQKEINTIVRLLDSGHNCLCIDQPLTKKFDAGHIFSRGSNPNIAFHLFNIWGQSVHANQWKGGMPLEFIEGLEKTFGEEVKEYCLSLKGFGSLNLSKEELNEKISLARAIVKWLKLQDRKFTLEERIDLRKRFNKELGIYKD